MNLLRSLVFALFLLFVFLPFTGFVALTRWMSLRQRYDFVTGWNARYTLGAFRRLLGITHRVQGLENIPAEPVVFLAKHQSAWETLALAAFLPPSAYVAKRELLRIPFFGWGMAQMPIVTIDRSAGKDALRQVVEQGGALMNEGYSVVIFPEGTRTAVGGQRRYKIGGATLAVETGRKVVPIAHNAGEFWPRNAFVKRPGEITVSIGPAIETAGRSAETVNAEAAAWIEGEMHRLFPQHYRQSLGSKREAARVAH
ncbi:lysophospholipid acyltransferase family protein [Uliginosibacterium aquaticum]|uniref:1-acyl-sn-glycerol-3-phosphate acyltransferase n=1 Tax=Uliginosibacterium aquaticum TaxID=2731212 RepID=A0ABX2IH85_9RHOO|nr:lysophospholipid acyltransferase family protein [Uliginosibacterium aquaticum]NSL53726.1 1-acyl-sn-glycerol-3-phosphate acyltransferase [Uliginosibacterium aquaticum]